MKASIVFTLFAAALCVLPAAAHTASLPYPSLKWSQFPERKWSLEELDPVTVYPDWKPAAGRFEAYFEANTPGGMNYGIATCQVYEPLQIAVAYYSTDGKVYLAHEPFPLAASQRITISWMLPPQEEGVSRLLLLSALADVAGLHQLLANPVEPGRLQPGIMAEQWLGRQPSQYTQWPWVPALRNNLVPPAGFDYSSWPACRAWLQPDLALATKDCWVETNAHTSFSLDEYGPAGRWELDWSTRFTLNCQLESASCLEALLVLTGKAKADFTGANLPELKVTVNGWEADSLDMEIQLSGGLQQYCLPVGQYLQAGVNSFTVQLDAINGGILQLDSVELWVR